GSQHFAEIYDPDGNWVEEGFCSWGHLAEWTAKGEPEFRDVTVEASETSLGERALDGLVLMGIGAWTLLAGWGLLNLIHRIW
ncbi:hypothetical protein, partial [Aeromicrobium sp.]|uniref:hypothetical protein n=1 Tax=Aeromicrobium sp. TaxID=1871063 RepID=UPI0025C03824